MVEAKDSLSKLILDLVNKREVAKLLNDYVDEMIRDLKRIKKEILKVRFELEQVTKLKRGTEK